MNDKFTKWDFFYNNFVKKTKNKKEAFAGYKKHREESALKAEKKRLFKLPKKKYSYK